MPGAHRTRKYCPACVEIVKRETDKAYYHRRRAQRPGRSGVRKNVAAKRTCECGSEYAPTSNGQKYCPTCRAKRKGAYAKAIAPPCQIICERCRKPIPTKSKARKYCGSCRAIRNRDIARDGYRRREARRKAAAAGPDQTHKSNRPHRTNGPAAGTAAPAKSDPPDPAPAALIPQLPARERARHAHSRLACFLESLEAALATIDTAEKLLAIIEEHSNAGDATGTANAAG